MTAKPQNPDYVYDPDDWEFTCGWKDRDLLVDEMAIAGGLHEPKEFSTLIKGPSVWAKDVVLTRDDEGSADETEVRWFTSLEEAEKA